jgi:excisionase family DNA binding protein
MEKYFYSPKECAELIGVSRTFLYHLWKHERGPRITRIGSRVFITKFALEEWSRAVDGTTIISEFWSEKEAFSDE